MLQLERPLSATQKPPLASSAITEQPRSGKVTTASDSLLNLGVYGDSDESEDDALVGEAKEPQVAEKDGDAIDAALAEFMSEINGTQPKPTKPTHETTDVNQFSQSNRAAEASAATTRPSYWQSQWSDTANAFFYHNVHTGEKTWDDARTLSTPAVPRPTLSILPVPPTFTTTLIPPSGSSEFRRRMATIYAKVDQLLVLANEVAKEEMEKLKACRAELEVRRHDWEKGALMNAYWGEILTWWESMIASLESKTAWTRGPCVA
ncbi:hypothetical protein HK104_004009 [Borealophlyctis nickersoniae]|nr:hypothetical protein HK104_004009 [Borealophlyctis nickersoniae]